MTDVNELCHNLYSNIKHASFANVLTIVDKIAIDEKDTKGIPLDDFVAGLEEVLEENESNEAFIGKEITEEFFSNIELEGIKDKRKIVEHFLCELKRQAE